MWPKYIVKDEFLHKRHFDTIKNIDFDTTADQWDIYKHKIFEDDKLEIEFTSSSGKEGTSPLSKVQIIDIHTSYHNQMMALLKELAPEKLKHYLYTELNVVNTGKDYIFPIHSDSRDKLLSVVIYIDPAVNEGTWLYEDKSGKNPQQIEWVPNRAFVFSRNKSTLHSYKADGKSNRLTLVYNLRSSRQLPQTKIL
jgi:hypothetical protein